MDHGDFILDLGFDRDQWEVRARCRDLSTESIEVYPELDATIFDRIARIGEIVEESGDGSTGRLTEVERYGDDLYRTVFRNAPNRQGRIGTLEAYFNRARERFDNQIRLRLQTADQRLLAVPWELLRSDDRWLVRSPGFSLVRHPLSGEPRPSTLITGDGLTVLGMVSNPAGLDPIDVDAERRRMTEALGGTAGLNLHWTRSSNLADLRTDVFEHNPHVFHFIGHGAYDPATKQGVLLFGSPSDEESEVADGRSATGDGEAGRGDGFMVRNADAIADLLDHTHLRLVVLNACETAKGNPVKTETGARSDTMASMAHHLMRHSVDAVVAMRWTITDVAAQAFSAHFYHSLGRTGNVGRAVEEARLAICNADPDGTTLEWAVPQFFMRAGSAQLFEIDETAHTWQEPAIQGLATVPPSAEADEDRPLPTAQAPVVLTLPAIDVTDRASELSGVLWNDPTPIESPARRAGRAPGMLPNVQQVRAFGDALHDLVVGCEAGRSALDGLKVNPQRGPAARLVVDVSSAPAELAALPWELLRVDGNYVSTNPRTPMVRLLDRGVEPAVLRVDEPLRVLVAMADPADEPISLRGEYEADLLSSALWMVPQAGRVVITRLTRTTRRSLADKMDGQHVLHFIGHGDTVNGEGAVLLAGKGDGEPDPLTASQFGDWIRSYLADLRLVFLNSCLGAVSTRQDRFTGLAQALVNSDVPAAIGMQYAIPDDEAVELASVFYGAIADGRPIDEALGAARNRIKFLHPDSSGWASPTLHVRSSADGLWLLPPPAAVPVTEPALTKVLRPSVAGSEVAEAAAPAMRPAPAPLQSAPAATARPWPILAAAAAIVMVLGLGVGTLALRGTEGVGDDVALDLEDPDDGAVVAVPTQTTSTQIPTSETAPATSLDESTTTTENFGTGSTSLPPGDQDGSTAAATDAELEEEITDALDAVGIDGVTVTVDGGSTTLSGQVDLEADAAAAVEIAASIGGVAAIDDQIEVEPEPPDFLTGNSGLAAGRTIKPYGITGEGVNGRLAVAGGADRLDASSTPPSRPVAVVVRRLGLQVTVEAGGAENGVAEVPESGSAAWYDGSTRPGENGATIIAGHVDYDRRPGIFFHLSELAVGDRVEVETITGSTVGYRVTGMAYHPQGELPSRLFDTTGDDVLHLITCGGRFDNKRGHYSHNLVVSAVRDDGAVG